MRIANKPAFYGTPDRKGRREVYADEYRDEESRVGDVEEADDVVARYHNLYEQRMNPFDQVLRMVLLGGIRS